MTTATLNKYTATFILDTRGYDEPVETLIEKVKANMEQNLGVSVSKIDDMGQQEFVRVTDRKFPAGIYVTFVLEAPASFPAAVQERFRLDKTVNRVLVETA